MSASSSIGADFNPHDINISVDLVPAAQILLEFLSEISSKPELHEGSFVESAIQRYERFWLPLVSKHPGRLLPAPLDIEWIWHCHLLAPEKYKEDCERISGKLIDHHLIDKSRRKELIKDSERLWQAEYADVPFSATDTAASWFDHDFVSALTYNITSAISRQRTFFYQVSLPHYRDDKFLTNALLRYKKFLYMKCHNPNVFLVPCYDNDLIWHSHMMFPMYYKDDTQAFLGALLPHDDSVNDRTKGSKLCVSEAKTRVLWKKIFNEKSSHFGAMFRGQPPYSKLHAMTKEDVYRVTTKQVNVLIEKVRITGLPQGKAFKLKLCYNTGYQNFNRSLFVTENIATVKGNARTLEDHSINTSFSFDTRYNDKVIASIQKRSGRLCLGTSDILGEGKLDLQRKIQPLKNRGLTANDDIDCGDGLSVALVWSCPAPELGPCVFRLEHGEYQGCVMPPDRESLWGPIPLPRLPPGAENICSVASHKLYNHMRKPVFTVRMIHSEAMLMSAIHVFFGNKMTAVAHLIVGDHLPLPSAVSEPKKCITLNPKEGQRAVLIKNHKGDWGVAVGWWEGLHRRGSGRKGSCSEGHLEVRFFHLPTHKWQYVSFDRLYSLATSKFEIRDCMVEFDSGFIAINSQRCEISENLALIFSVTLIHVLCQPRPTNWAPGLSSPAASQAESTVPSLRLGGSEEITMLIAAGVLIATPCNHAIRNLFKKKKQAFGERSGFRRSRIERQDEVEENEPEPQSLEPNGGPAVILHEAEVNPGWDQPSANSARDQRKHLGRLVGATRLMSITEQQVDEAAEEEETEEEETKSNGGKRVAILVESEEVENTNDPEGLNKDKEDNSTEDEEEKDDEENVFAVEEFGMEGDGQAYMFGDGESDSDEVQADDDDDASASFKQGVLLAEDEEEEEDEEPEDEEENEEEEEREETVEDDTVKDGDVEETGDVLDNETEDIYNGMVNGFEDDYMDDAETFFTEFYNIEGESNHEALWNVPDDGNTNDKLDDDVFIPSEQYNGFGDHNSSFGDDHHDRSRENHSDHNTSFGYDQNGHNTSFGHESVGKGDNPDKSVGGSDHSHSNSINGSHEGMNGDIPDAIDTGGDGGACGGCGG